MPTKKKPKETKPPQSMTANTVAIMKHMDNGVSIEDSVKLVKGKNKIHPNTKTNIKKAYERYSLTKPKVVKLAHDALLDTINMVEVVDSQGNVSKPSHTNRLTGINMVLDRAQPVVRQNMNVNVNADIDPVDLSVYLNRGE